MLLPCDRQVEEGISHFGSIRPIRLEGAATRFQNEGMKGLGRMSTHDVILAIRNGQNYLAAMLDSLLSQTTSDFNVIVRDNGSTDGTLGILESYQPKFSGRLRVIEGEPTGSATSNFAILMRETNADYVLWADHDDIWKPDKVELTLRSLKEAETKYGKATPIYFFSDFVVVNGELDCISPSYWKWKRINPANATKLSQSLICCSIQGMASGINRALVDLSNPIPEKAVSHDWWAQLLAAAMGKVIYDLTTTALYRVHGENASVPKQVGIVPYVKLGLGANFLRHGLRRRITQAEALLEIHRARLPPDKLKIVEGFLTLQSGGPLRRRIKLVTGNYLYPDVVRNLATLALM